MAPRIPNGSRIDYTRGRTRDIIAIPIHRRGTLYEMFSNQISFQRTRNGAYRFCPSIAIYREERRVVEQLVDSSIVADPPWISVSVSLTYRVEWPLDSALLYLLFLALVILSLYFSRILLASVKGDFALRLDGSSAC